MARFKVNDYIFLGCTTYPIAASWQVALDSNFTQIIDESIEDRENITEWNSPLPKIDGTGFYSDEDAIYCRVKFHVENGVSDWFVMEPKNQNDQEFIITENGEIIDRVNSLEAGIN